MNIVISNVFNLNEYFLFFFISNFTPIPKGPHYSSVSNYRPISLTPILSKVFGRLVSVRLGRFMECRGVLPTTQFDNRKGLGTCDAIFCVAHTLQSALEMLQQARIVQIDFSAALTGSTIRGFYSSSVLWEFEVQRCLFWHTFSLFGHSISTEVINPFSKLYQSTSSATTDWENN